ncbi:MAG: type II toxin-antitoxin system RelE/ParE family toxin, partial [Nanoarchaeota archaeon]|nr:type II toxin-antitoxin system RelE/ParE family toxin [Nanoarchaeota archaeon]
MYSVEFSKKAEDQLNKLPLNIQIRVVSVLDRIKINPFHFVKRKQGTSYYTLRVGEYRVILDIKQEKLLIFVI